MAKKRWLCRAFAAAAALLLAGCQSPQTVVAQKIADRLPSALGPAKRYDVDVDAGVFELARGDVNRVTITGQDVVLTRSLTVDALTIDAHDLAVDRDTGHLQHAGEVTFECEIGQRNLDNYIAHVKTGLKGLSIVLRRSDLQASVPVTVESLTTTARLSGRLVPSDESSTKLDFVADGASLGFIPLPVRLVNLALEKINPTLDFSTVRIPLTLRSADVVRGRLHLRGSADLQGAIDGLARGHLQ